MEHSLVAPCATPRAVSSESVHMANFHVREATEQDCADIMRMITELAVFEKMEDQVAITANDLKTDGFGDKRFFDTFVAELVEEGQGEGKRPLVGYLMYYYTYSPWYGRTCTMEDFYVAQEFRGNGIGSALLAKLTQRALTMGCSFVSWVVVNWNQGTIDFYKRRGARDMTEQEGWLQFRLDKDAMVKLVADSQQTEDSSP